MAFPLFRGPAQELFAGRTGSPFSADGRRDYVRRFRVMVTQTGKTLGPVGVCSAPDLPLPFSSYINSDGSEYDILALCTKLSASQENSDDWQSWIVQADYSTVMPDGGIPNVGGDDRPDKAASEMNNPENDPPEFEWDFEVVQKAPAKDLDGKAFVNSAQQPFSPPPTFEVAYPVMVMTRNELNFNIQTATAYAYAVNSDKFLGAAPGTAQCLPPKAKMMFRGTTGYYRVSYRIRFGPPKSNVAPANLLNGANPIANIVQGIGSAITATINSIAIQLESWQPQILDAGTMKKGQGGVNIEGRPIPIVKNGIAISQPVLLDGNGREQKPDANGFIQPVFLQFRVYLALPFNRLLTRGFVP